MPGTNVWGILKSVVSVRNSGGVPSFALAGFYDRTTSTEKSTE